MTSLNNCQANFISRKLSCTLPARITILFLDVQKLRHILFPCKCNWNVCSYWQLASEGLQPPSIHLPFEIKIYLFNYLRTQKLPQHYFPSKGKRINPSFVRAIRIPLVLAVYFSWMHCNWRCYWVSCHRSQVFHQRANKLGIWENWGKECYISVERLSWPPASTAITAAV